MKRLESSAELGMSLCRMYVDISWLYFKKGERKEEEIVVEM